MAQQQQSLPETEVDPKRAARSVGLRYVTDTGPGITRHRVGKHFAYRDPEGRPLRDRFEIDRIKRLAIPPAWTDVWICPNPKGHLQATGRDARGRKQYRYHPEWRAVRDATKFDRMLAFGQALPKIRERVAVDMARRGLPREKVLATIVRLLETTLIRVGNPEYARENDSYGLTTLRDEHVEFNGAEIVFEFRAKAGKMQSVSLKDRRLARIVHSCQELPGQHLFQYVDEAGDRQPVDSADVNEYLREIAGEPFTAKDFRTWAGTVLASLALREFEAFDTKAAAKRNVTRAIEQVAAQLGNTVAVCRSSYVHPEVFDSYLDGSLVEFLRDRVEDALREKLPGLRSEEAAVLAFLQQRLSRVAAQRRPGRKRREEGPPRDLKAALRKAVRKAVRKESRGGAAAP